MRIGTFITLFPSESVKEVYGAGRVAYYLSKELVKRGRKVHVFVPFTRDHMEIQNGVTVHFYKSILKIGTANISLKLLYDSANYDLDVVHLHCDTPISAIAALSYVNRKRKPFVVTWHGDWIESYGSVIRRVGVWLANKYLVNKVLSEANIIITPSKHYIEESRFLKKFEEKIVEIPNGVDFKAFNIPYPKDEVRRILGLSNKNVVLYLSALYELKGPHILLKAIPKVVERYKDVFFVFVGGGEVEKYKRLARKLCVEKHVKFTGYIEESAKPLYYKAADIFVLPSIETFEVFPLAILEASAAELPMIVSNLKTFKCIIEEGYNGLFVKRRDPESLANALIYLLENDKLREEMGKNARKRAERYSWERIAEETEKVYEKILR